VTKCSTPRPAGLIITNHAREKYFVLNVITGRIDMELANYGRILKGKRIRGNVH
jgi:hypothetical protein